MKKSSGAVLVMILLFSLLAVSSFADTGVVNASSLNIRESASSKSDVIKVVKEGARIEIKGTSGSWYKVSVDGKTGYAAKKYLTVSSEKKNSSKKASTSSSNDSGKKQSSSDGTCKKGDQGDAVKKVQKRLKELGYYSSSVDGDFGDATKTAVRNFQKNNGLTNDGVVGKKTLEKLNSSKARKADSAFLTDLIHREINNPAEFIPFFVHMFRTELTQFFNDDAGSFLGITEGSGSNGNESIGPEGK